jgi:hypothetical protein
VRISVRKSCGETSSKSTPADRLVSAFAQAPFNEVHEHWIRLVAGPQTVQQACGRASGAPTGFAQKVR